MLSIFWSPGGVAVVEDPYLCQKWIITDPAQQHRRVSVQVDEQRHPDLEDVLSTETIILSVH